MGCKHIISTSVELSSVGDGWISQPASDILFLMSLKSIVLFAELHFHHSAVTSNSILDGRYPGEHGLPGIPYHTCCYYA